MRLGIAAAIQQMGTLGNMNALKKWFKVVDSDGAWGAVKAAGSERAAREKARAYLKEREVWPKGSLLPDFKLRKMK
jgi:hypothetical protein